MDDRKGLIDYAVNVVQTFSEGSAALAADWYDEVAKLQGMVLPAAELAELPTYGDVAKTVNGVMKTSQNVGRIATAAASLTKRAAADTTLQNAKRDRAEFAWVPVGDTCPFCLQLASYGWRPASKKTIKGKHAEHIHANCDCEFAIRFGDNLKYASYNPEKYAEMFENAEGTTDAEKRNYIRRMQYQDPATRARILEQKRVAYAARSIEQEKKSSINDWTTEKTVIGTKEYRDKFAGITDSQDVNERLYIKAIDILDHRDGTDYEDMHLISIIDGTVKGTQTKVEYFESVPEELRHQHVWYNESLNSAIKNNPRRSLISLHNHPGSLPPSGADFKSQFDNGYLGGVIACHDGTVYYYEVGKKYFSGTLYDMTVDKYKKQGYSETDAYIMTLEQFVTDYGIKWRRL